MFAQAVLSPPENLAEETDALRKGFDGLNRDIMSHILSGVRLRPGITTEDVIEAFSLMQNAVNAGFRAETGEFCDRERLVKKTVEILLYGAVEEEQK